MISKLILLAALIFIYFMAMPIVYAKGKIEKATFAGGCFWCLEHPFEKLEGVNEVISGYTGGHMNAPLPTYEQVSTGITGHVEAVQITYDPSIISYQELLEHFFRQVDPTDHSGQFADRGSQYTTAIFYHNEEQKKLAEESKDQLNRSGRFEKPIVTEILEAAQFHKAEKYHQDYYKKNPIRYKLYRDGSGRDTFLHKIWGEKQFKKPDKNELSKTLTPLQHKVTQENGTERSFDNKYWNNKKAGIYVDIVSGEPLFSSADKFDLDTGWPSFSKPLEPENIVEKEDPSFFMKRTEVRSRHADSHLGHVFNGGPLPSKLRYCINSASLRFIPKENLEKEGYGKYTKLFE